MKGTRRVKDARLLVGHAGDMASGVVEGAFRPPPVNGRRPPPSAA
jgi:hypothetical protein